MFKPTKIFIAVIALFSMLAGASHPAEAYVSVGGYTKKNGTYVKPYVRSNPNGLKYDNYGYKPSQGLLNSTYGTRSINWDTPTWTTDPDYSTGLQLYKNKTISVPTIPKRTLPVPAAPKTKPVTTIKAPTHQILKPVNEEVGIKLIGGKRIQTFNDGSQLNLETYEMVRGATWMR